MTAHRPARRNDEPAAIGRAIDRVAARRLKAAKAKAPRTSKGAQRSR